MTRRILALVAAAAVAAVILWWWGGAGEIPAGDIAALDASELWADVPPGQLTPAENYLPVWAEILGGDEPFDADTVAALGSPAASSLEEDLDGARAAAAAAATRRLTDAVHLAGYNDGDPYPNDEPDDGWAGRCTGVEVASTAVMALPAPDHIGGVWAKAAALYTGSCPDGVGDGALRVTYVYLHRADGDWTQVRPTQVPWSANTAVWGGDGAVNPAELVTVDACGADGGDPARLAPEAAATWEVMCADAADAGVELTIVSAHRDPTEQAERAQGAARRFHDPATARRWVASVDSSGCASRHCAGAAVDVADPAARGWVNTVIGCMVDGELIDPGEQGCGATPVVTRGSTYGWVAPLANQPWHLEYSWPITSLTPPVTCSPPPSMSVPETIAAVWRCRLGAAGYNAETTRVVAAEATQVARCSTGWNNAAVEAGGRWRTTPDPATGQIRDGTGVFLLSSGDADRFSPGGAAHRTDPRASAAGAAAAWISEHVQGGSGWSRWPCAEQVAPTAGAQVTLGDDAYTW